MAVKEHDEHDKCVPIRNISQARIYNVVQDWKVAMLSVNSREIVVP